MTTEHAPPRTLPRGNNVNIDIDVTGTNINLTIHYLSYTANHKNDDESLPTVVFLHGSGPGASAYSNFKYNIDTVTKAGYRALLIDMPGFGYSSKPTNIDYTTDFFADCVTATLNALAIKRCMMVGNSLGGAICIRIALDNPSLVSQLVLMAPGGIESRETYFAMPGMAKMVNHFVGGKLEREGLRSILCDLIYDASHVNDTLVEERYYILQQQPPEVLSRMKIPSMEDELKNLQCPILGFWGQQDEMTPATGANKFLNQCSDCHFIMIAKCGHWVMVEYTELFNQQLNALLV